MLQICEYGGWFGKQTGIQFPCEQVELPFCLVISQTSSATQGVPLIIRQRYFNSVSYLYSAIAFVPGTQPNEVLKT